MHPKLKSGLETLLGATVLSIILGGAGGVVYQSCWKQTTLTDVTVTEEETRWVKDYETWEEFIVTEIKVDKYTGCIYFNHPVKVGDKFKSLTYSNNFLFCKEAVNCHKE
ncbi:MAG: hypothetical protein V2A62_01235 [Candidatus Woesearchaeota archaeon]